jgi:pilus assembly protein CpaC
MIMKLNTALLALSLITNAIGADLAATGLKADNAINKAAISVSVNGSTVLDESVGIRRISIANAEIAEAVAVSTNEIVVNGKTPGDTSLIVWDLKGNRSMLDVHVVANTSKIDSVRAELLKEAGADVTIDAQEGTVFLNGTVANETSALRAFNIASTMGKVVNLLRVNTPAAEPQILLKVRFADIDRTAASQFALNLFQMSNSGIGTSTTGQFGQSPTFNTTQNSGRKIQPLGI